MTSSPPLNLKVMLKYLLILLLCLVIYASTRYTTSRGLNTTSHISVYDALKPEPVCNSSGSYTYSSCFPSPPDTLKQGGDPIGFRGSLISENGTFKLGFFVRGGNTYLGIWYNTTNHPEEVIVWVANRENPIPRQQQSNCSLFIGGRDGIARLLDSNNHSYWSTSFPPPNSYYGGTELQLQENGNLILKWERGTRSEVLWQSFENPTDTLLEDQWSFFSTNSSSIPNVTSWEGPDNPAPGNFTLQIASFAREISLSVTRNNATYWVSTSSPLPIGLTSLLDGSSTSSNVSRMLVMNSSGSVQLWELDDGIWSISWMAPKDQCDLYETCGSFGVCDPGNGFMCKCLPGFAPHDPVSWESKHFTADQCSKTPIGNANCTSDVFLSLPMIKLPPNPDRNSITQSEQDCKDDCLNDCGCKAYSFNKSGCQLWNTDLSKIQEEFYDPDNRTLLIRVSPSYIDFGKSACGICGCTVIPYPLSTNSTCGDSNYSYFQCKSSNGQVYFKPITGNLYKVSHINEADMKFVIQLPQQGGGTSKCDTTNNIHSNLFSLTNSLPFSVTNCSVVQLLGRPLVEEVEISWNPPPPPPCLISSDCSYWPNTSCYQDVKVCKCAQGFHSHLVFLNCIKVDDHKGMSLWIKVGVASTCVIVLLLGAIFVIILCLRKRRATRRPGITAIKTDNDIEDIDIPFVDYESILYATDNFSEDNKLGVGGFGPVYKGKLVDGNAVAIKRLSAASTQGAEEFRNEVILIAKLQHRNLVRVLGYCAKENEKILIYEYMPSKSLDAFLFDHTISPLLDWIKRINIIMGIARGLLYLHQDSRLIIIHRDLKPSNILLDEELNPKISDFGLARIVAGNEMAASTARIIGTHGYMSPEYALDGYFSIKSDVYSFGIIVLETICGRRCASLLQYDNNLISLLGYAWFLWDKGDPMELVDESVESYDSSEVKRCINVGLLCVQEDPSDRPTMSNVLLMLSGDNMNLPYPKQPVFVARRPPSETASGKFGMSDSNVELTTTLEGR